MLERSDEFELEFKKVICLFYYYGTIKIVWLFEKLMFKILGFIRQGINGKIDGTKKQFERSMVF